MIDTALSVVLARIVDKNRDENTSAEGDGIKYAAGKASDFIVEKEPEGSVDSPAI